MGIGKLGYAVLFVAALILVVPVMMELAGQRVLPIPDSAPEEAAVLRRIAR